MDLLRTKLFILTLIILLVVGCKSRQDKKVTQNISADIVLAETAESSSLDGYWILTDYIDSILRDQSISKYRLFYIAWFAMSLNIQKDSLFSTGFLHKKDNQNKTHQRHNCFNNGFRHIRISL